MDFDTWIAEVWMASQAIWDEMDASARLVGFSGDDLGAQLGVEYRALPGVHAITQAVEALIVMRLLEDWRAPWSVTQEGLAHPHVSFADRWGMFFADSLDAETGEFLAKVVDACHAARNDCAYMEEVSAAAIVQELKPGIGDQDAEAAGTLLARTLDDALLATVTYPIGKTRLRPTYGGYVRVQHRDEYEAVTILRPLLANGETTNVDFKRELNLGREKEKAEFVRDVLGLANTKSPGDRHMIIGVNDAEASPYASAAEDITQDRLEQILTGWSEPTPDFRYFTVPWESVRVGVVAIRREPLKVPYLATKSSGKLKEGIIYCRHGSHTEPATERERRSLFEEGERARAAG